MGRKINGATVVNMVTGSTYVGNCKFNCYEMHTIESMAHFALVTYKYKI